MAAPQLAFHIARLQIAYWDRIQKDCMSAQNITGLADVIRQARTALAGVPSVAEDMKNTTASVLAKVKQVQALTDELKSAEAELTAVISQVGNGSPPLDNTTTSAQPSPASSGPVEGLNAAGVKEG